VLHGETILAITSIPTFAREVTDAAGLVKGYGAVRRRLTDR
jgi:hypothetical protein